jgi:molybdopterin-guanine dinucleotide biosynthesis protein
MLIREYGRFRAVVSAAKRVRGTDTYVHCRAGRSVAVWVSDGKTALGACRSDGPLEVVVG